MHAMLICEKGGRFSLCHCSKNKLCGWKMVDNFNRHPNGRILVIWKEELVALVILETSDQAIHCQATLGRRSLWEKLRRFNSIHHHPWILLGDFNNVLRLSDLRSTGAFFTWTNNSVWCKLDRVMVNNEWTQRGMLAQAQYDPPGKLSDHSPCSVSFMEEDNRGPIPFKFFNMWVKHDNFQAVVRSSWDLYVEGTAMFRLCKKLKTLKDPLKSLNKLHFSHISIRSAAAEEELQQAQQQLHNNPNDSELQAAIPILRAKALKLAEAEMSFCSQIAKAKFLKNTDKGTKFFHNMMIKSKRTRNNLPSISLEDGSRSTSSKQVRDTFVQYYRGLLGTKRNCSRLNPDIARNGRILDQSQSLALVLPVTEEEIKNALFSIGVDKAPGPDGYSSLFFKQAWDIVGRDVTDAVLEFFSSGQILKQINHSIIALIPKTKDADKVENFRPIACCNVVYKIISKIIATRMGPAISSIIDPAQAAFIQNRSMVDNIFLLQELLRQYSRKRTSPRCTLNVDLRKAYDSIDWTFIKDMLSGRGDSVGDPISPFIFVLCLEYLSRSLRELHHQPDFNFHPRCGGLKITHLAYADDLVLFSRGDPTSVSLLMEKLNYFGECSGLCINQTKSCFHAAGICNPDLERIKEISGVPQGSFPFRYLGIPVADSRFNSIHHHPWILLGDFNNVLSNGERINGMPVTTYEIREFKECCYDLGLSDLRSTGAFFTWTNNSVWCKLDRVMVNNEWTQRGMLAQAQYDPPGKLSDHSPCSVSFMEEDNRGPIPFKFFNIPSQVLEQASFLPHIPIRSAAAEEELQQAQQQLHNNPNDSELQAAIPILRAKALKLAEAEMSFCSQIAKAKFLKNTDKGTKFFHNMIKSKRTRNNLPSISLEDGSRSTSSKQILLVMGGFWISPNPLPLFFLLRRKKSKMLSSALGWTRPLAQMVTPPSFFKQAWDIVGRDVTDAVLEFFSSGQILKQINHSIIALIPKTKDADKVENFRPIACCNVVYKIISKIIATRMGPAISSIIDPAQAAFIQNRSLRELHHQPDFNFHPRCGGLKITHLAYADDLVLFSRGDPTSVSLLMEKLNYFGECSGLCINQTKSCFHAAGICNPDLERIKEISGVPQGSFPFRYLGIPVADSRLTISQYSPLIDRISDSISAWAGAILSYAGRTELIKSVLQGVECYWLSILPIPAGVKSKIVQLCRNFLWSGKCTINKKPLVAWKEATLPKIERRPRNAKLTWPKLVWHAAIIPRHSFILWLGLKDRLLTKNKLRDYIEDQSCPLCSAQNETLNHLFFQCTFGKQIWANIKSWLGISQAMQSLKATVKWLIKEARGTGFPAKIKRIGIACMVYSIWEARNKRIFEGKVEQPDAISRPGDYPAAPGPCSSFSSLIPDVDVVLKLLMLMLNYQVLVAAVPCWICGNV
ncbi:hypothetical protein Acr_21g0002920 [Actinidia rufa]|uniref:Reverse transcriptase domain-containing protein n=1 Tax=Actinidia rufa TaxID=165716 RepID=A0A7J0GFU5_9ERIC|nr:hypothetical protein Acr_21g0002920 [Actinidia rufa]